MLKRTRKVMSLLVVQVMVASLIAGCGSNNASEDGGSTAAAATTAAATTAANKEPVTVDWLAYNTYAQPVPNSEVVKRFEQWFNIKFNFWYLDDQQWDQVLGVKLAAGEMPDVLRIKSTAVVPKYVKMGVLTPITDDMLGKIPAMTKGIEEMGGTDLTVDGYVDGRMYCLKNPAVGNSYPTVVVWRTDWLKNLGMDRMPENLTEWETAMDRITNGDPDKDGKKDTHGMSNTTMNTIFGAYGAIPLKEFRAKGTQSLFFTKKDGKYAFAAVQPEMKEALALLQKWYKAGYIDPEFITGENTGGYWAESQSFENNKLGVTGMVLATHWNPPLFEGASAGACLAAFQKVNPDAKFGVNVDIGKPPEGPDGKSGTHSWGGIGTSGVAFTTKLAKDPAKMDIVLHFINSVTSDYDQYLLATFGVEGTHYKLDPVSGSVAPIEPYNDQATACRAGLTVFQACFSNPDFDKKLNPLKYQFLDKYKCSYYTDMYVPATDAATKYTADLQTLTLDSYIRIITGGKPVDYFDEFVKTFNEKGGAAIVKEVNDAAGLN
jgi:putative aldouronate transport system substrate-binding protein